MSTRWGAIRYMFSSTSTFLLDCCLQGQNVGQLCISILHNPGNTDIHVVHEPAAERWNPTQSISSILISIVSLLADPNPNSIANVDAGVAFRKWRESKEKDQNCDFLRRIRYSYCTTAILCFCMKLFTPSSTSFCCVGLQGDCEDESGAGRGGRHRDSEDDRRVHQLQQEFLALAVRFRFRRRFRVWSGQPAGAEHWR